MSYLPIISRTSSNGRIWHKNVGSHPLNDVRNQAHNHVSRKDLEENEQQKSENNETTFTNESLDKEVIVTTPSNKNNNSKENIKLLNIVEQNFQENGKTFTC